MIGAPAGVADLNKAFVIKNRHLGPPGKPIAAPSTPKMLQVVDANCSRCLLVINHWIHPNTRPLLLKPHLIPKITLTLLFCVLLYRPPADVHIPPINPALVQRDCSRPWRLEANISARPFPRTPVSSGQYPQSRPCK